MFSNVVGLHVDYRTARRARDELWLHNLRHLDFLDVMKKLQVHVDTMRQSSLALCLNHRLPTEGIPPKICKLTTRWRNERYA